MITVKVFSSDNYSDADGYREWQFFVPNIDKIISATPKDLSGFCEETVAICKDYIQSGCRITKDTTKIKTHEIICVYLN